MIKDLIKKAKKGDKKAFGEIIIYYQNDLYKIARTRLNQNDDIEDAVQETIISAYQSLSRLINISKFKSWLITILINKCNEIHRKRQKYDNVSYDYIEGEKYLTQYSNLDSNLEFDNLMNSLNTDEKTILVLYYGYGYKTKEISKILKINDNTVRTKMSRAKKKLEDDLKEGVHE